jgi:hypothetical protein
MALRGPVRLLLIAAALGGTLAGVASGRAPDRSAWLTRTLDMPFSP